jgi:hypothetical protein
MASTGQRLPSTPRDASVARLFTTDGSRPDRIQLVEIRMPGSVLTAWLPLKFKPRKAGAGLRALLGT